MLFAMLLFALLLAALCYPWNEPPPPAVSASPPVIDASKRRPNIFAMGRTPIECMRTPKSARSR